MKRGQYAAVPKIYYKMNSSWIIIIVPAVLITYH